MVKALSYDDVLLKPIRSSVGSRIDTDLSCVIGSVDLKYPIMSAAMDTITNGAMATKLGELGCIGIIHRFQSIEDRYREVSEVHSMNLPVGVAIGLKDTIRECVRLSEISSILALDVAHAHHDNVIEFMKELNDNIKSNCSIMVGNIVTYEAATDLINAGADILKVGIGGGSVCSTRIVTGFGVPNLTAILDVCKAVDDHDVGQLISVVADGGIRNSGDIAKAIAAGADCVMLGSLLAGTFETPGIIHINEYGYQTKEFRGMASNGARSNHNGIKAGTVAEGVEAIIPYKGGVYTVIDELVGGLRSALTYGNARNLKEFYANTEFIEVTSTSINTSRPHILHNPNNREKGYDNVKNNLQHR